MKIPRKYNFFLSNLLVGILMTLVMSFFLTLINIGYVPNFWPLFWRSFGIGLLVAIPTTFTVVPLVNKLLNKVSAED